MKKFILSADLGQVNDYTAITIFEIIGSRQSTVYHLRHIERPALGTPYPKIVDRLKEIVNSDQLREQRKSIVIDITGGGRPVWDMVRQGIRGVPLNGVSITGGDIVTKDGTIYRVPKRDLISAMQVAFQGGQLKIARELPLAGTLITELTNFKVKISASGHDQYEAWRESIHDDIVLSAAMAVWLASYQQDQFNVNALL